MWNFLIIIIIIIYYNVFIVIMYVNGINRHVTLQKNIINSFTEVNNPANVFYTFRYKLLF